MSKLFGFFLRYLHAAAASLYLFTLGFANSRHRGLIYTINEHFGFRRHRLPTYIPEVEVSDVVPADAAVCLREEAAALGNISLLELVVIDKLVRRAAPKTVFEIGTFDGRTTLNMAANAPDGAHVYTLDLPRSDVEKTKFPLDRHDRFCVEKEKSGARFSGSDCDGKITQLYGDSARFDYGPYLGGVDFVFVDGAHSYEYVLSDSKNARALLRGGKGIILWHDYDEWDGVTRALNDLFLEGKEFAGLRRIKGTTLVCLINL